VLPGRPPALNLARRTLLEVGVGPKAAEALVGSRPHRLPATGIAPHRLLAA
jgi:hypothetical protein